MTVSVIKALLGSDGAESCVGIGWEMRQREFGDRD